MDRDVAFVTNLYLVASPRRGILDRPPETPILAYVPRIVHFYHARHNESAAGTDPEENRRRFISPSDERRLSARGRFLGRSSSELQDRMK
jgi:hypothetical protein